MVQNGTPIVGSNYFRIKTEWTAEGGNGFLGKVKTEELVYATSYTEAEQAAYAIAEDQNRAKYGSVNIEIVKTKIDDILFNDILKQDDKPILQFTSNYFEENDESGVGLYAVKIIRFSIDEKTGKTKRSSQILYTPALNNADAAQRINSYLKAPVEDYVIRDVKFDNAEAIYWPQGMQKNKSLNIG